MKKIKMLKNARWSFRPNEAIAVFVESDIIELADKRADLLINAGHAEEIKRGRPSKEIDVSEKEEKKQPEGENKMVDLNKVENKQFKSKKKRDK